MRRPHSPAHLGGVSAIPAVSPWKLDQQFFGQTIAFILLGLSLRIIFLSTSALMCHPVSYGRGDNRELKHQTFTIHGGQPEVRLHKFFALRLSHSCLVLSRRAPRYFSRSCRFATTLRILQHFFYENMASCGDKDRDKSS